MRLNQSLLIGFLNLAGKVFPLITATSFNEDEERVINKRGEGRWVGG